jgi:hypothetical protein
MVHSAHARHVAHHPTTLSAAQTIKYEQLFDSTPQRGPTQCGPAPDPRQLRLACGGRPAAHSWPGQSPPSWPVAAISPGARPCPGPSRREQGVPSTRSAPTTLRAPGRRRLHRDRPSPATGKPGCHAPPAWRLPPSASAVIRGWSRPRTASDSGGAPHERFLRPRTCSVPGLHTPRRCPGRINLPEPARVKPGWRTRGGHVENVPPALPGASRGLPSSPPQLSWA